MEVVEVEGGKSRGVEQQQPRPRKKVLLKKKSLPRSFFSAFRSSIQTYEIKSTAN